MSCSSIWFSQFFSYARLKSLNVMSLPELLMMCGPIFSLAAIFWPKSEGRG
jgi:hypothetical protein